jgi:general secretion pathway protein G
MELVVTLALLGLLASLAAPLAEVAVQRSKERQLRNGLHALRHAIDAYKRAADSGLVTAKSGGSGYPASLDALTGATTVATKGDDKSAAATIVFLRELPRDPFADPSLSAAATWGLRSYASPPDQPAPGEDVFDVYTRAEGKGLNGVAYREW